MKITTNTSTTLSLIPGRDYTLFAAGAFGNGVLSLSFSDPTSTTSIPLPGHEEITENTAFVFTAPATRLNIELENATAPDIVVDCVRCPL